MHGAVIPLSPGRRTLVTCVIMGATLMVILDTTIANVALPQMQASLGATPESIAWVLTSYIIASAIAMPVTGWLAQRLGRRFLFTVAIAGFTGASALCGVATSLEMLVVARLIQGVFGAFLLPLGQAAVYDINPPERHAHAMTIWGLVIMVGPVIGPWLGGWLTDTFDWRWVFFINVPIGLLTAFASWLTVPDGDRSKRRFDLVGFALLSLALASFQLMLDRGTQLDWFDSIEIILEAAVAIGALWMFVVHIMMARDPLIPLALFANRNFVSAIIYATLTGGIMMAGAALIAPMTQRLLGYSVLDAGMLVVPRGFGTIAGMLLAGRLVERVDNRALIFIGVSIMALSLHFMTGFDLEMGSWPIVWTGIVQGVGLGFTVLPLNLLALATLAPSLRTEAASLYSLMRSLGGSIAISITTLLIARNVQVSHSDLATNVTTVSMPFLDAGISERVGIRGQALAEMLDMEINRQALMIAYIDDYWIMMWAAILSLPVILLMRGAKGKAEMMGE